MALIINADDLGLDEQTTDAILEEHRDGRVSSATAMVFMADSVRAADAARAASLPVGLHLNLTERFTACDVPAHVQIGHDLLVDAFAAHLRRRRWIFDPRLRDAVRGAVVAQLWEFRRLYGSEPTHLDGHQHVHATLNVLLCPAVRLGLPYRRTAIDNHATSGLARSLAGARQRLADSRFPATGRFLTLSGFFDERTGSLSRSALGEDVVEVMVHPGSDRERALLRSDAWATLQRPHTLTSYDAVFGA